MDEQFALLPNAWWKTPYLFNGNVMDADRIGCELDPRTSRYYYSTWYYDHGLSVWLSVDPLADAPLNVGTSPYSYVWNNPIMNIDPDGRHGQSTIVTDNGDGTFKVVGGDLNDGDKGIYVVDADGNRTGEKLGESLTMYSFFNADSQDPVDQQVWKGTIDINSTESGDLVSKFMSEAGGISL